MMNASRKVGSWSVIGLLAMAGCDAGDRAVDPATDTAQSSETARPVTGEPSASMRATTDWQLDISERGGARLLYPASAIEEGDEPVVILTCVASGRLIVRLPRVAPISSEERLSIGSGEDVVILVADSSGSQSASARGELPLALDRMLERGFAAAYGATSVGELPSVPADMRARWRSSCS